MHHTNNAVIMQTEQLGRIKTLEEELCSFKEKVQEQDRVITQLVGDNLEHLQDNMRLTAHINSVRVCASSQINPSRLSNQFRTGADRCTPTLPR